MPLTATITGSKQISKDRSREMFNLQRTHFDNVREGTFMRDLFEKDYVILLHDECDDLHGFSTIQLIYHTMGDRQTIFLFSGDTVVDPKFWQSGGIAGAFGRFVLRLLEQEKNADLYWFLISKGYRTYRFLPTFFHEFYPVWNRETPLFNRRLLDFVGRRKFKENYCPSDGLVKFGDAKDRLCAPLATVPERCLKDPHVSFFLKSNPGYARGDELTCIAPLTGENFSAPARRVIRTARVIWEVPLQARSVVGCSCTGNYPTVAPAKA